MRGWGVNHEIQDLAVAKFLKEFSHGIKTAAKSGQPDAGIGAGTPADDVAMSAKSTPASVTASRPNPTHPMNPVMITPTIGAVVHFYRPQISAEPVPALVCRVWSDRMINLGGFDCDGVTIRATWVTLV